MTCIYQYHFIVIWINSISTVNWYQILNQHFRKRERKIPPNLTLKLPFNYFEALNSNARIHFYKITYLHISELVATETLPLRWGWGRFSNGLKSHWISRFQRDLKEFHPVLMTVAGPSPWGLANQRALKSGPKTSLLLCCLETILFSWNKSFGQQLLDPHTDHSIFRARSSS